MAVGRSCLLIVAQGMSVRPVSNSCYSDTDRARRTTDVVSEPLHNYQSVQYAVVCRYLMFA